MTPLNFQAGFTDQTLQAVFDETPVTLRLRWNERFGFWSLGTDESPNDFGKNH
ncbi:hypothetical protein [Enterobacter hormaechei]|uniref:phage baseplate plug family protein n=1 Tax=Enterobacter hormaechei TaxID=158836 RepID=UPI000AFBC492|nr:hypothetical protein [Enterobacter hormaechei]